MQLSNSQSQESYYSMTIHKIIRISTLILSGFTHLFAINPNSIKNHQHINEISNLGTIQLNYRYFIQRTIDFNTLQFKVI